MPKTIITFNGLLVFRPDPANDLCEVGVLRARAAPHAHILQIQVTPNPATGSGTLRLNPDDLENIVQQGNIRWRLEVELNGQPVRGIDVNTEIPADRHNPTPENTEDFGWIVNVESDEFHGQQLARLANRLQPVISLSKGRLFTSCKTDSVDIPQGPHDGRERPHQESKDASTRSDFGFIAGAISLEIDTSAGEIPVLYFIDQQNRRTEIFRLLQTDQRNYFVGIMNTPLAGRAGGHFHLFYERLFHQVGAANRFNIIRHQPPIAPPAGRCPEAGDPEPDPFKCGGVSVGTESGPLG